MAPRPNWKGYLKLSLVSCPVALFPSATASEKVSFHLLNEATGNRLKQQYIDGETGDLVERGERVRGFEIAKGDHIVITEEDLDKVQLESNHTIDIETFVPKDEIDAIYLDSHYYLVPDDKVGQEAFAVIREAMDHRAMVGIARVVLFGRERMVMLEPRGRGILLTTLHYAYEVRGDAAYFGDLPKPALGKDLLDLASHIIDTKTARFDPSAFKDRYQDAVLALIEAKRAGKPLKAPKADKPGNVIDLMDALKRSLGSGSTDKSAKTLPAKTPPAKTAGRKAAAASRKPASGGRKAAGRPVRRKAG